MKKNTIQKWKLLKVADMLISQKPKGMRGVILSNYTISNVLLSKCYWVQFLLYPIKMYSLINFHFFHLLN